MKTYVISLASSAERRARMSGQLDPLGCPYQFFDAINGQDGYASFNGIDRKRYLLNTGRSPAAGEIGCYASHVHLWNICIALQEPIVVVEDDSVVDRRFGAALEAASALISRFGFIRLQDQGPREVPPSTPVEQVGEFTLSYWSRYPYGAMCYAVAPATAAAFVRASQIVTGPVDLFIKQMWVHGRPLYALSPPVVRDGDLSVRSTIDGRGKESLRLPLQAQRALTKLRARLDRGLFNLRHRPRGMHKAKLA